MKRNTVKKILSLIFAAALILSLAVNAYAETVQERLEGLLQGNSGNTSSILDSFNEFIEENGLDEIDLSGLTDTEIAQIFQDFIGGGGNGIGDLFGLAQDAFSSGLNMIMDVINGGNGTSDGSNTASGSGSGSGSGFQSPNVIVEVTTEEPSTVAVGIPDGSIPSVTQQPETTTYNVGDTTAPNIVGSGITTPAPTTQQSLIADDGRGMSTSAIVVLVVLSVATLAVIITMVVFFLKRKEY